MNKKVIIIISTIIAITAAGVFALNMKSDDKIVAMVNNEPVYESTITKKIADLMSANFIDKSFSYQNMDIEMKKNIIKSIVVGDLIDKKAADSKIEEDADYKKAMQFEAEQLKQKIFLDKQAKAAITDAVLKEKYDDFVKANDSKEEAKATHIVFADEKSAKDAADKIAKGEKFEDILKANSSEDGKNKGGDLDYFTKEQMPAAFSDAVFALDIGKISAPIKTEFGWHIVKLIDKRKVKLPSLEEMMPKIKAELMQKFMQDYIDNLIKDNKVEVTLK